jgi:hypothetical protein
MKVALIVLSVVTIRLLLTPFYLLQMFIMLERNTTLSHINGDFQPNKWSHWCGYIPSPGTHSIISSMSMPTSRSRSHVSPSDLRLLLYFKKEI